MRTLSRALLVCALVSGAVAAAADEPDPSTPEGAVSAAEARRYRAMIDVDVSALEKVLADDLRYVHANGNVETKYQLIASLESGNLDYQVIAPSDVTIRVNGDSAAVTGVAEFSLVVRGTRAAARLLYTAVYKKDDGGRWQLWVYQSTRHPDPA